MSYALLLAPLGYTHRDVMKMTPAYARELWLAMPDPELMPTRGDNPGELSGMAF